MCFQKKREKRGDDKESNNTHVNNKFIIPIKHPTRRSLCRALSIVNFLENVTMNKKKTRKHSKIVQSNLISSFHLYVESMYLI